MGLASIIGIFDEYEVAFEPADEKMDDLALNVNVKTASVDTRIEARDAHLKSADFFDSENYPDMVFESTSFRKKGRGYELSGNLTLKGVTKPIKLKVKKGKVVTGLQKEKRIGFVAAGTVKRSDFNIKFNMDMDNGFKLISDEIEILISMEFIQS
jgi:polyisoprenoid-binding protein YceI